MPDNTDQVVLYLVFAWNHISVGHWAHFRTANCFVGYPMTTQRKELFRGDRIWTPMAWASMRRLPYAICLLTKGIEVL